MSEGYIKLHRKIFDWEWYGDPKMVALWLHLLLSANYEDKEWRGEIVRRGELVTSLSILAAETGLTVQEIRTCLKKLESNTQSNTHINTHFNKQINTQRTNKFTKITICNYDSYQLCDSDKSTDSNTQSNKQLTRETTRGATTTKENKNITKEKDIKKEKSDAAERLYQIYPATVVRKDGNRVSLRSSKDKEKLKRLLETHTEEELENTIRSYLAENHGPFTKMFSTFLNNLPDYGASQDATIFGQKPWKEVGQLYDSKDFLEHMDRYEYSQVPLAIKGELAEKRSVMWDGEKFIIPPKTEQS